MTSLGDEEVEDTCKVTTYTYNIIYFVSLAKLVLKM